MAIKNRRPVSDQDINRLADDLADKAYGEQKKANDDPLVRTSITIPQSMLFALEDAAVKNKRNGDELKSVSAIVRAAVETYL